jgi:hypothetical protein
MLSPISLSENLIFQLSLNPSPFGVKNLGYDNGASLSIIKSQSAVAKICLLKFDCFHNYL